MAKSKGFNVESVKNPRKQLDADAVDAFVSGADYNAGVPAKPEKPEKTEKPIKQAEPEKAAQEVLGPVIQEHPEFKDEKILKKKTQTPLSNLKSSIEHPWNSGSAQLKRNILVQIDDVAYKKLEYIVGRIGTRMSIRKFAIEAVQNRIEDELKKILK